MRTRTDESGMSLVELMVVLLLMSVVGALLFGFLASVLNTTTRMSSDTQTEKQIELALRPVTENIRSASAIATSYPTTSSCPSGSYPSGYSNCLAFTIARPTSGNLTCPQSVMVYGLKADGVMREDRTDYGMVSGVCGVTQAYTGRPLLKNIANGGTPLFTYFDAFGNQLDPSSASPTAFAAAVTVRVSLNVQYRKGSPLLTYTSDLAVRNNR
jgi:type II secretory pathway component PulJ